MGSLPECLLGLPPKTIGFSIAWYEIRDSSVVFPKQGEHYPGEMMTEMDLELQARSLADLVEYQAESVVSRALLTKSTGSVTLFAFDKDQSLSEHTTPYDALVLAVDGELEITIAGDPRRLARGDLLLMPANKPHAVHATARSKMVLIMIRE